MPTPFRQDFENPYCYTTRQLALPAHVLRDINRFPTLDGSPEIPCCWSFSCCYRDEICLLPIPFRQDDENPYCYTTRQLALPVHPFRDINRFPTLNGSPEIPCCWSFSCCYHDEICLLPTPFRQDFENPCCYTTRQLALPAHLFRDINRFPTFDGSPEIEQNGHFHAASRTKFDFCRYRSAKTMKIHTAILLDS